MQNSFIFTTKLLLCNVLCKILSFLQQNFQLKLHNFKLSEKNQIHQKFMNINLLFIRFFIAMALTIRAIFKQKIAFNHKNISNTPNFQSATTAASKMRMKDSTLQKEEKTKVLICRFRTCSNCYVLHCLSSYWSAHCLSPCSFVWRWVFWKFWGNFL
jgi:hypothetical protein